MSYSMQIQPASLAKFNRDMDKYNKEVHTGVRREVQRAAINVEREAKQNVSNSDLLGTRSSVKSSIFRKILNKGYSAVVRSAHKASVYIEEGTKRHNITPRNAPYLHFKVGTAGSLKTGKFTKSQWVRTKLVRHPGTRPDPFMGPAYERVKPDFIRRLKKIL